MLTVPGEPQDVKINAINSTSIHVAWKPPQEKEKNGIIRGYHVHVQELRDEVGTLYQTSLCAIVRLRLI